MRNSLNIFSETLLANFGGTSLDILVGHYYKHSCGIVVLDTLWENIFVGQIFDVQWDNPDGRSLDIYRRRDPHRAEVHNMQTCVLKGDLHQYTTCSRAFGALEVSDPLIRNFTNQNKALNPGSIRRFET